MFQGFRGWLLLVLGCIAPLVVQGQIDPEERRLIQAAYNQPIQGHEPTAAYGFYYWNQPHFYSTNLTLRLAVAPLYIDGELGFEHLLGPNTDVGIGIGGGGFADNYYEFQHGVFQPKQSFHGDGGELSASVYHLFNPGQQIPLYFVEHIVGHQSFYSRDSDTANNFELPDDRMTFHFRSGLRFGGQEPSLTEPFAMELSVWHEAQVRTGAGEYGFYHDRKVQDSSQLLWGRTLLKFGLEESEQLIQAMITAGTSWEADRFSAYRVGGILPFSSEFPLSLPGYFYQEMSAKSFALLNAQYSVPLPMTRSWRFDAMGAVGWMDYVSGLELPYHWNTGVAGGLTYISRSGSWLATVVYGHGFQAIRSHGRGADQIAFLFQYDFEAKARGKSRFFVPGKGPSRSRAAGENPSQD